MTVVFGTLSFALLPLQLQKQGSACLVRLMRSLLAIHLALSRRSFVGEPNRDGFPNFSGCYSPLAAVHCRRAAEACRLEFGGMWQIQDLWRLR
eukprot:s258_g12.t1